MSLNTVIYEKDREDLKFLSGIFTDLGHQVVGCSDTGFCQAYHDQLDICPASEPCHDVLLLDNQFTGKMTGLEFIAWQRQHNCKVLKGNIAIMEAGWLPSESKTAEELGLQVFSKPFLVKELIDWLYQINRCKRLD